MRRLKLLHITYRAQHAAAVNGFPHRSPDHPSISPPSPSPSPSPPHLRLHPIPTPSLFNSIQSDRITYYVFHITYYVFHITYYFTLEDCDYHPYRPYIRPSIRTFVCVYLTCIDHGDDLGDLSMLDTHVVDMRSPLLISLSLS